MRNNRTELTQAEQEKAFLAYVKALSRHHYRH